MVPRTHSTIRTMRWLSVAAAPVGGMKSTTCPIPSSVKNRVTRTAVSGRYICFEVNEGSAGRIRKWPPRSSSSRAPKTLGESKRGQQNQSIEPSVVTSAAVCRSPMRPCSAMAVSCLTVWVIARPCSPWPGDASSARGERRRALLPGRPPPAPVDRGEKQPQHQADEDQVADHLHRDQDPGPFGHRGDVPEADRREHRDHEVEAVDPAERLGEGAGLAAGEHRV